MALTDDNRAVDWTEIVTCDAAEGLNPYDLAERWADRLSWPVEPTTHDEPAELACMSADEGLCRLVAHHSCAAVEAEERGLAEDLVCEFVAPRRVLADALTYCDMSTAPDGQPVAVENRLAEIQDRYGPRHLVTRVISRAAPRIIEAVRALDSRTGFPQGTSKAT